MDYRAMLRVSLLAIGALVGVFAVVIAIAGWPIWSNIVGEYLSRRSFDSAEWKSANERKIQNGLRAHMVHDLLGEYQLRGMTGEQVRKLLGSPMTHAELDQFNADGFVEKIECGDYVYWLGPERSILSFDSEWLVVRWDGAGQRVVDVFVHHGGYDVRPDGNGPTDLADRCGVITPLQEM